MTPALNRSVLPKVPTASDSLPREPDRRLPVPQALMLIVLLAALCWLAVGVILAWLLG